MNRTWQDEVLGGIESVVGSSARDEVDARWQEHAARARPEITLLGPYGAGKSSLLRRLLVEDGVSIPEWLTVSARRETFELNEVDATEHTFTDAPGFAANVDRHDELAEDALALSDGFLLVVPPQLLTSNRELVAAVLSGAHFFGRPGGAVPSATVAVVSQADSLGIDPEDDLEGMRELASRKRDELVQQLRDVTGGELSDLRVVVAAADPFEEQARAATPDRSAFDAYREWDGIDHVRAALAELGARGPELRAQAHIRYMSRIGRMLLAEAGAMMEELEASATDLGARSATVGQLQAQVNGVIDAARADLVARIVGVGAELSEQVSAQDPEAAAEVQRRLDATVEQWDARWTAELDLVLGDAEVEVDRRLDRPASRRTDEFLHALASDGTRDDTLEPNSRVLRLLNDAREDLASVAKSTFELKMGESLEGMLAGAQRTKHPKGTPSPPGAKPAATAANAARAFQAGLQVAEGVLAIATTIEAELRQQRLDDELRQRREAARDALERSAQAIASAVVDGTDEDPGWHSRADVGVRILRERLQVPSDPSVVAALEAEVGSRRAAVDALAQLLDACPALAGRA